MKFKSLLIATCALTFIYSCSSTKVCTHCNKKCEVATLHYLPDCKEIKGYVYLEKSRLQKVFQHELPEEFRKDSMRVCIKYEKIGTGILMSDCVQSEIIRIKCIKEVKK